MAYKAGKEIFYSVLELSRVLDVTAITIRRRIKAAGLEDVRGMGKYLLTREEVVQIYGDRFSKTELKARLTQLPVTAVFTAEGAGK